MAVMLPTGAKKPLMAGGVGQRHGTLIESRYFGAGQITDLFEDAMTGIFSRLDKHSGYIAPSEEREFDEDLDQQFDGGRNQHRLGLADEAIDRAVSHSGFAGRSGGHSRRRQILRIGATDAKGLSLESRSDVARQDRRNSVKLTSCTKAIKTGRNDAGPRDGSKRNRSGAIRASADVRGTLRSNSPIASVTPHQRVLPTKTADELGEALDQLAERNSSRTGARSARTTRRIPQAGHRRLQHVDPLRRPS